PWFILIGAAILWHQGQIRPIADFLSQEQYTIKIGKTKVTPYLILKTIFILIMFIWFALRLSDFAQSSLSKVKTLTPSTRALFGKIFSIIIYIVVFLIGLDVMGLDLTALAVFSGAIGIGLGFGLQKIASNFISGLILLFEGSVEEGDLVDLGNGAMGTVRKTNARHTLIECFDGKEIMIPNEDFITSRVTNLTYSDKKARIDIKIGVAYDSNLIKAKEIMLNVAKNHPKISTEKPPSVFIDEFAESSINILLYAWIDDVTDGRLEPKDEILIEIWQKFKEEKISIPFPQREIRIINSAS
ncbi:MAG: mechanosensitive ion channel, partial [Rickettsiales bacterium]|nr:mechanosensitive ion channel [Rickettsiales bacterium]